MSLKTVPAYYADVAIRGNTFYRQYRLKASDASVDLTGYVVRWRGVYGDQTISKTTADGTLAMTTPTNGTVGLLLSATETRLVPEGENMRYELEIVAPDDSQHTILWGDLVGKGGVTLG